MKLRLENFLFVIGAAYIGMVGAKAVPITEPFVIEGNTVTTPGASGLYPNATFRDPGSSYTVTITAAPNAAATLTNSSSVLSVGAGSSISIGGGITINDTATTSSSGQAVQIVSGTVKIAAGGEVNGGYNAIDITDTGIVTNSGALTGSHDDGVFVGNTGAVTNLAGGVINGYVNGVTLNGNGVFGTSTVDNYGSITGARVNNSDGILIRGGIGLVTNYSTGTVTGGLNGIVLFGVGEVDNLGAIMGSGNDGVHIEGAQATVSNNGNITALVNGVEIDNDGTVLNSGSITGTRATNSDGVLISGDGSVTNLSGGTIQGGANGILIRGSGSVTNFGSIIATAANRNGILVDGNAAIVLEGGSVSGPGTALQTNFMGGAPSTVSVIGRSSISGVMSEKNGIGILNLNLIGLTPAEASALRELAGSTSNTFTVGTNVYHWNNLQMIDNSISLEEVVDSGLVNLATKIDNSQQGLSSSFDPFYRAAASNPESAVNTLSGRQFDDAFAVIGLNNASWFADLADNRAFDLRSGAGGFDLSGLTFTSSSMIASLGQTQGALNHLSSSSLLGGTTMSDSNERMAPAAESNRWGAWASGTVSIADASSTFSSSGFHYTTGTPTIGADYRVTHDFLLGTFASYSTTGANFGDGSRLNVQNELFGLYGTWNPRHWYVNGLIGGGLAQYDNQRSTFEGAAAQSSPSGSQIMADATVGYDFILGNGWRISPEAGLQYTRLHEESFAETGAGAFNLDVADQDVNSLRTKAGFRITDNLAWDGIKFTPQFHAAWYHECLDDSRGVSTSLPGAPALGSFIVGTTAPERDYALVGAGICATPSELHDNVTFFLDYDAQVGQSHFIDNTFDGGLRIGF